MMYDLSYSKHDHEDMMYDCMMYDAAAGSNVEEWWMSFSFV